MLSAPTACSNAVLGTVMRIAPYAAKWQSGAVSECKPTCRSQSLEGGPSPSGRRYRRRWSAVREPISLLVRSAPSRPRVQTPRTGSRAVSRQLQCPLDISNQPRERKPDGHRRPSQWRDTACMGEGSRKSSNLPYSRLAGRRWQSRAVQHGCISNFHIRFQCPRRLCIAGTPHPDSCRHFQANHSIPSTRPVRA